MRSRFRRRKSGRIERAGQLEILSMREECPRSSRGQGKIFIAPGAPPAMPPFQSETAGVSEEIWRVE